ncbi:WD40-repeat-containing domain protein [Ganoderma leucocontextum]|nr:WD40-repeat-containing domain protein [Ganoderma leucocontextum]
MLQYQELHQLHGEHTKAISNVAFSPKGNYIATSGLDGRICVWGLANGALLHLLRGLSAAVSLVWVPPEEDTLICGLADGSIACIDLSGDFLEVKAVWAHPYPVECLAVNGGRVVVGAGCKLSVWGWDPVGTHRKRLLKTLNLDAPPRTSHDELREVLVTSIHWTFSPRYPSLVVVTYMNHGALFLEPTTWTRVHTLPLNGQILGASVSADSKHMAVFNALRGCDVYSLTSGVRLCATNHEILENYPTPVLWIHGGLALLEGSTAGQLTLWDLVDHLEGKGKVDPRPRILYRLPIPKSANVMSISVRASPIEIPDYNL